LRNGEEEEMGYEDLSTIGDLLSPVPEGCRLRQTPPVSILISAGSSYKDHNFVRKKTEEEKEKEDQEFCSVILPNDVDDAASGHRYSR
jgi:hypothetical protein